MEFTITYSYVCSANQITLNTPSPYTYSYEPTVTTQVYNMPGDSATVAACPVTRVLYYDVAGSWVTVASSSPAGVSNYDTSTH